MAINVEIEPVAIHEMRIEGFKNDEGVLIKGESIRLPTFPNNIIFGGIRFTCIQIDNGGLRSSNGDQKFGLYRPTRG